MGNSYHSNMWLLDTAGAIWSYTTKGPIKLRKLVWHPAAAADQLLVSETDGGVIWQPENALAGGAAGVQSIDFGDDGEWYDGFTLTTLTAGGKLHVYFA